MEREATVVAPISFSQRAHHKLALAGESGAGKSTLLQIIAGLVQPTTGEIRIEGEKVRGPHVALVPGHPGVAYLSQKSDLPHSLRVEQVLRYANQRPEAEAQAVYALCRIAHLLPRRTDQLSGGEQQRVALARAFVAEPALLLADEPTGNLDRATGEKVMDLLFARGRDAGSTLFVITHDPSLAARCARVITLGDGQIVSDTAPV